MIAYHEKFLKAKWVHSKAEQWKKLGFISTSKADEIMADYSDIPFSPSYVVRALFFIAVYIGSSFLLGPFLMAFSYGDHAWKIASFVLGCVIWFVSDRVMIQARNHYKSGVTEAGLFASLFLLQIPFFDYLENQVSLSLFISFIFGAVFMLRYLNFLGTVSLPILANVLLYQLIGGTAIGQSIFPFVAFLFNFGSYQLLRFYPLPQKFWYYEEHRRVLRILTLVLSYLSLNYFMVRTLTEELLRVTFTEGQDLPMAFIFYAFTALFPLICLYLGWTQQSKFLLRIGLALTGMAVFTFKYYFSLGHPEITLTITGAILVGFSLLLLKLLKKGNYPFTADEVQSEKEIYDELLPLVAGQTLGVNAGQEDDSSKLNPDGGGKFGGAGAGGEF